MSVPAQIAVLLALTANLFDPVPLDKMTVAGNAVREAAATMPKEVSARFETAAKLNDEDKKTIVEIARKALAPFQPKPETKPEVKTETKTEPKAGIKDDNTGKAEAKPKPEVKAETKPEVKSETKPKSEPNPEPQTKVKSKPEATPKEKS